MNTLERLERANPVTDADRLLSAPGAMDDFILAIKQRSGIVQTAEDRAPIEVPTQTKTQPPHKDWRRRFVPSLVAAAAVIAAIVLAVVLLGGDDEPDVTNEVPLTPLEVGEALNLAHVTGDWEAKRRLFADDATFSDLSTLQTGQANPVENVPFSGCLGCDPFGQTGLSLTFLPKQADSEWDGDDTLTVFDVIVEEAAIDYTAGVTRYHSCTQTDATTVVCNVVLEGSPFLSDQADFRDSNTFTVVDGLITHQLFDYTQSESEKMHSPRVVDYQEWVRVNRPELESQLFKFFGTLRMTPSVVETHRELIAEWRAQT